MILPMKELAQEYLEYVSGCEKLWKKECGRTQLLNKQRRDLKMGGFDFPVSNEENTPSFDGFMTYLVKKYTNKSVPKRGQQNI